MGRVEEHLQELQKKSVHVGWEGALQVKEVCAEVRLAWRGTTGGQGKEPRPQRGLWECLLEKANQGSRACRGSARIWSLQDLHRAFVAE